MNVYKEIYVTRKEQVIVQTTQYTNAVPLIFQVMDWQVPTAAEAAIYVKKPSGLLVFNSAAIGTQNEITVTMTTQMTAEAGNAECQIRVTEGDDVLNTFIFILQVEETIIDDSAVESQDEFTELQEALNIVSDIVTHDELKSKGSAVVPVYFDSSGSAQAIDGPLPINKGGTGGTDINSARENLQAVGYESSAAGASIGSLTRPVYIYRDGNGRLWARPVTYNLGKSVPADAVFTDTVDLTQMSGVLPLANGGTGGNSQLAAKSALRAVGYQSSDDTAAIGNATTPVYITYNATNGGHFAVAARPYSAYLDDAVIPSSFEYLDAWPEAAGVASETSTLFGSKSFPAGKYVILLNVRWATNTTGRRDIWIATSGGTTPLNQGARKTDAPVNGYYTYQQLVIVRAFTTATTLRFYGLQTSGNDLEALVGISYFRISP